MEILDVVGKKVYMNTQMCLGQGSATRVIYAVCQHTWSFWANAVGLVSARSGSRYCRGSSHSDRLSGKASSGTWASNGPCMGSHRGTSRIRQRAGKRRARVRMAKQAPSVLVAVLEAEPLSLSFMSSVTECLLMINSVASFVTGKLRKNSQKTVEWPLLTQWSKWQTQKLTIFFMWWWQNKWGESPPPPTQHTRHFWLVP